jgi:hypothetical protein
MEHVRWLALTAVILSAAAFGGCTSKESGHEGHTNNNGKPEGASNESKEDAKVKANLAKLSAEDRQLAEAQKLCPISDEPLGSMGTPVKVPVKDQPVLLCCKSCQTDALAQPDKTLAKVNELKKKAPPSK